MPSSKRAGSSRRLSDFICFQSPVERFRSGVTPPSARSWRLVSGCLPTTQRCGGWGPAFGWLLVAGTAGNLVDSVLGATLERGGVLRNNAVNFINTLTGAMVAGGLGHWLG